jgi:enamine deaminase RidA (YjgF/YER057c/UK114 family)
MENLKNLLDAVEYSLSDVLKVLIFLKRTDDFAGMNRVYSDSRRAPREARFKLK